MRPSPARDRRAEMPGSCLSPPSAPQADCRWPWTAG